MILPGSIGEVIALENEIMAALPGADAVAMDGGFHGVVRDAHDILCNSWRGPGERLDRLREIAGAFRGCLQ